MKDNLKDPIYSVQVCNGRDLVHMSKGTNEKLVDLIEREQHTIDLRSTKSKLMNLRY